MRRPQKINKLNCRKATRNIVRFLIGLLVIIGISSTNALISNDHVFGVNSPNNNLRDFNTSIRQEVSICISGFCINTPNIPDVIKAPIEQSINSAVRDQLRSFLSSEIPITGTEHKLYPSISELPGGRFAPNVLYLSGFQSSQVIPPGDYEIPVHFYCTKVYTLNGAGNRFRLARLEGRLSNALSALYQRASLNKVPIQDVQVLSWSMQSGIPYDNLSKESKNLVNRLIPDYRQELNGSFTDQTINFWNTLSATTRLPSLDETLNQLGDVGAFTKTLFRAREEIIRSNFSYRNLANNFVVRQDFNLAGGVESTPWSQINDRVYLRFIAPNGALKDGVAQVRIVGNNQNTTPITSGTLLNNISQSVGIPEQNGQAITATVNPPPEVSEVIDELRANPEWKRNLDPCPCTLKQARDLSSYVYSVYGKVLTNENANREIDFQIIQLGKLPEGVSISRHPLFVESSLVAFRVEKDFHPGASYAFRSHSSRVGYFKLRSGKTIRPGQQCTYDSRGKLITDGPGAGTPDAYAPEVTGVGDGRDAYWIGKISKSQNYKISHTYWDTEPFNVLSNKEEDDFWYEKSGWKRYQEIWTPNNGNSCPYNYKTKPGSSRPSPSRRPSPFYNLTPPRPSPRTTPLW